MSFHNAVAAGLLTLTLVLLAVYPSALVVGMGFIASTSLFGFLQYLERKNIDLVARFEADLKVLETQLKRMDDRIQALMIGRGR